MHFAALAYAHLLWLLPALLALIGFGYILISRKNFEREVILAVLLIVFGTAAYLIISDRLGNESRRISKGGEQEHPVEELAQELKQAWSDYHNR